MQDRQRHAGKDVPFISCKSRGPSSRRTWVSGNAVFQKEMPREENAEASLDFFLSCWSSGRYTNRVMLSARASPPACVPRLQILINTTGKLSWIELNPGRKTFNEQIRSGNKWKLSHGKEQNIIVAIVANSIYLEYFKRLTLEYNDWANTLIRSINSADGRCASFHVTIAASALSTEVRHGEPHVCVTWQHRRCQTHRPDAGGGCSSKPWRPTRC